MKFFSKTITEIENEIDLYDKSMIDLILEELEYYYNKTCNHKKIEKIFDEKLHVKCTTKNCKEIWDIIDKLCKKYFEKIMFDYSKSESVCVFVRFKFFSATLHISPESKFVDIKREIWSYKHVNIKESDFTFKNRNYGDDQTLGECGITKENFPHGIELRLEY